MIDLVTPSGFTASYLSLLHHLNVFIFGEKPACLGMLKFIVCFQVQDAQATMRLYTMISEKWEKKLKERRLLNKHLKNKITDIKKSQRKID